MLKFTLVYKFVILSTKIFGYKYLNHPFKVVWIKQSDIKKMYTAHKSFPSTRHLSSKQLVKISGVIKSGDWDLHTKNILNLPTLDVYYDRFVKNLEWEDTSIATRIEERIKNAGQARGCKTFEEYKQKHLNRWDELYRDILNQGFKINWKEIPPDQIQVAVNRYGELIFLDGRNRYSIATILKISYIPVIITVVHQEFYENLQKRLNTTKITPNDIANNLK